MSSKGALYVMLERGAARVTTAGYISLGGNHLEKEEWSFRRPPV